MQSRPPVMSTHDKVRMHTPSVVNHQLDAEAEHRLAEFLEGGNNPAACHARITRLDQEWEMERVLALGVGVASIAAMLASKGLGRTLWSIPAIGGAVLVQQTLTGGSLLAPLLRRMGFRSRQEIEIEKYALKSLRGDFRRIPVEGGPLARANAAMVAARA